MKEFEIKPIMAERRMSQETLDQYNALGLFNAIGCLKMAIFLERYNESATREFYANLTVDIVNSETSAYGQVYVRRAVIAFSLANIVGFLSCLHQTGRRL